MMKKAIVGSWEAVIGGIATTVALFRETEKQQEPATDSAALLSGASKCVWKLDSEA